MSDTRVFGPVQLARWLGLSNKEFRRALNRGLVPPPDVDDSKWSQALAMTLPDQLPALREALAPEPTPDEGPTANKGRRLSDKDTYGSVKLARLMGLKQWQVRRARDTGVMAGPDLDNGRWSPELAQRLVEEAPRIAREVGDHPGLGSHKAAERLAERTELPVTRDDVRDLATRGELRPVGEYVGAPLYSLEDLDTLPQDTIQAAIDRRRAWIAESFTAREAADHLGWPQGVFEVTAERTGLQPGALDRYARADIDALAHPDTTT